MNSVHTLIAQNTLFANLPEETLDKLAQSAIRRSYAAREIIVLQEDVWPYLFLVAEGQIDAVKESAEGRTFVATTLKPGDIFWGLGFFIENAVMPVMLQVNSDAVIDIWAREIMVPIIKENGDMAWNLCQIMIQRMQLASEIVEDLAFHPVMSRLARLLLDISGDSEDEFIAREYTLEEMAARISTTREIVCRYLYRFAEKGAIEIRRTELKVKNRDLLEKQAKR